MILLSENSTHSYYAIEVPRSATTIKVEQNLAQTKWFVYWGDKEKWDTIRIPYEEPEFLGVAGLVYGISEKVASEICGSFYSFPTPDTWMKTLKDLLELKGILIENPMGKPDFKYTVLQVDWDKWQSYEYKLVKAVIIKVKK